MDRNGICGNAVKQVFNPQGAANGRVVRDPSEQADVACLALGRDLDLEDRKLARWRKWPRPLGSDRDRQHLLFGIVSDGMVVAERFGPASWPDVDQGAVEEFGRTRVANVEQRNLRRFPGAGGFVRVPADANQVAVGNELQVVRETGDLQLPTTRGEDGSLRSIVQSGSTRRKVTRNAMSPRNRVEYSSSPAARPFKLPTTTNSCPCCCKTETLFEAAVPQPCVVATRK